MERWKTVEGYEGLYEVSDQGRVRSLGLPVRLGQKNKMVRSWPQKILKSATDKDGYLIATLCNKGVRKTFPVHRLVGRAFVGGYFPGAEINHIDGVKHNNHYKNLEWVTGGENMKHAYATGLNKGYVRTQAHRDFFTKNRSGTDNPGALIILDLNSGVFYDLKNAARLFKTPPTKLKKIILSEKTNLKFV